MKYNFILISLAIATPVPKASGDNGLLSILIGSGSGSDSTNSGLLSSSKDKDSSENSTPTDTIKSSDSSQPVFSQDRFPRSRYHRDDDEFPRFHSRSRFDSDFDEARDYDWEDDYRGPRSDQDGFRDGRDCRFFANSDNDHECESGHNLDREGPYTYQGDEATEGNQDSRKVYRRDYQYRAHRS